MTPRDRATVYGTPGFWIRSVYMEGFQNQSITAVIRPGDRSTKEKAPQTNLPLGVDLPVRFIKKSGNQKGNTGPDLFPDDGTTVCITECIVKKISELTEDDLRGMAPDTATPELVRYHLATIYDTPLPNMEDIVTIWRFEYVQNATV